MTHKEDAATADVTKPEKPSLLTQLATGFSQMGLAFYSIMLFIALFATSGRHPNVAILMAILALVPSILGPGKYRLIGLLALAVAGAFYLNARPIP